MLLGRATTKKLEQTVEVVKTARAEGAEPEAGRRRSLETGGTGQLIRCRWRGDSLKPHERNPAQPDERCIGRHNDAPAEMRGVAEGRADEMDVQPRDGGKLDAQLDATSVPADAVNRSESEGQQKAMSGSGRHPK